MKKTILLIGILICNTIAFAQIKFTIYGDGPTDTELIITGSGSATTNGNATNWTSGGNSQVFGSNGFNYTNSNLNFDFFNLTGDLILTNGATPVTFINIGLDDDSIGGDYDDFILDATNIAITSNTNYTLSGSANFTLTGANFGDLTIGSWTGNDFSGLQGGFNNFSTSDIIIEIIQGTPPSPPVLTTSDANSITKTSAILTGNVTSQGTSSVTERGIVYSSTDTTPEIGETGVTKDTNGTGTGVFSETISSLQPDTKYYYRAYAVNSVGNGYGAIKSFTTLGVSITTIERENPSLEDLYANTAIYKVTFSKPVKEVDITDFTTNSSGATISNVNQISSSVYEVTLNNITANGNVFLQIKGVDGVTGSNDIATLAVAATPNITVNQTASNDYLNQSKIGQSYTSGVNGALKKVTFYPEAGQHTFVGTADLKIYSGNETSGGIEIHSESISITNSSAAAGQEFTLSSNVNVTQGSTYSLILTNFSGTGSYALSANTTNEYAGGHVIFTGMNNSTHLEFDLKIKIEEETNALPGDLTLVTTAPTTNEKYIKFPSPILPIIVTTDATSITNTQATLGGIINNSGATAITERGVVYATTDSYPKIGETGVTKFLSAQSITTFSDNITGLSTANTYFYRAYATNSNGTGYGEVKRFSLNNALHFDGTNDDVNIPNYNYSNGFSFDALLYPTTFSGNPTFLSRYSSNNEVFAFIIKSDGTIECTITNDGSTDIYFTTVNALTVNTWQHVAFTYNNTDGSMKFYINGTDAGSGGVTGSPSGALYNTTDQISIGTRDGSLHYQGAIDELRIWDKTLSESVINNIKNKVVPTNADGLLAYYQFNQGIAEGNNTAITQLFNKKNATLEGLISNFAKTGTTSNFIAGASGDFSNNNIAKNSFMTTGNWSTPGNWSFGKVPTQIETAFIDENQTVTIDVDDLEMDELELGNNATLNIPADKEIVVNNDFTSNGNLSLNSDKTNAGVLLLNGTTSGSITYKRGGLLANEWYIVTPPVTGQTIKTFAENAANDIRINTTPDPDRYAIATYDDSKAAGSRWVYYDADVNASDEFIAGQSYSMSRATNGDFTFTGTLSVDDVTKTVIAGKWNAIGNPFTTYYPANKNSTSSFLNDNIDVLDANFPSLYLWDDTQSKYVAVTELDALDRSLPPGQGFFVKIKAGETEVSFQQEKRSLKPSSGDTGFQKTAQQPSITLQVSKGKTTVATDIKYFENATIGFDPGFEIGNFNSAGLDIYTRLVDKSNTTNYTIQSLPTNNYENMVVPIGIKAKKGDEISFSATYANLPNGVDLYLEDKLQNLFIRLNEATQNEVKVVFENDVNDIGRFYLHTSSKSLSTENLNELNNISIYTYNKILKIKSLEENASIKIYSVAGKLVLQTELNKTDNNEISLTKFSKGVYMVYLQTGKEKLSKKIILK